MPEYKIPLVAEESFRVYRRLYKEQLPHGVFPDSRAKVKNDGIIYVTRAVTFDKCYYDKYTYNEFSRAHISVSRNSSWLLVGSFGPLSLEACQRKLLDEGWSFIPLGKAHRAKKAIFNRIPLPPKISIYEAFTPEALKTSLSEEEEEPREEHEWIQEIKRREASEVIEFKLPVKPLITHVSSEVEKSLSTLELVERMRLRKLEASQKRLADKTVPKARLEAFKSAKKAPREFKSKEDMLAYIKTKLEQKGK